MNILHYTMTLDPKMGGVVAHVSDLARLVHDAGHQVTIATPHADPRPANLSTDDAPRIVGLGPRVLKDKLLSRSQLDRFMDLASKADAVHLHEAWDPAAMQIASRLRKRGIPYAATPHGMLDTWCMAHHPGRKKAFLSLLGKRYFAGAAATLFCAQGELEQATRFIDTSKGHVVPAATDLSDYQTLPGPELATANVPGCAGQSPVILFLSRIDHKKGLEFLIDAMPIIHKTHQDAQLVVAGAGDPQYIDAINARIREREIQSTTHLVGLIRGEEKVSLYQRATMLALPTYQENFGLVLTECLAAKTPVVTTKGVDIWPELESCGGGLLVKQSADAFAQALNTLIKDPGRCDRMGAAGREWVMEALSSQRLTEQFVSIYEQVVKSGPESM